MEGQLECLNDPSLIADGIYLNSPQSRNCLAARAGAFDLREYWR